MPEAARRLLSRLRGDLRAAQRPTAGGNGNGGLRSILGPTRLTTMRLTLAGHYYSRYQHHDEGKRFDGENRVRQVLNVDRLRAAARPFAGLPFASRSVRRALLTPQVNPTPGHSTGIAAAKSTQGKPVGPPTAGGKGPEIRAPQTTHNLAGRGVQQRRAPHGH